MAKLDRPAWLHTLIVVTCLYLSVDQFLDLDGTEFSGGLLTGKLLYMNLVGAIFFACALVARLFSMSGANITAITGAILCIPLQIFKISPEIFYLFYDKSTFSVTNYGVSFDTNSIFILLSMIIALILNAMAIRPMPLFSRH